jgi:hypothetical protein
MPYIVLRALVELLPEYTFDLLVIYFIAFVALAVNIATPISLAYHYARVPALQKERDNNSRIESSELSFLNIFTSLSSLPFEVMVTSTSKNISRGMCSVNRKSYSSH